MTKKKWQTQKKLANKNEKTLAKKNWKTKKKNLRTEISPKRKTGKIEIKKNWQKIGEQNSPTSPSP